MHGIVYTVNKPLNTVDEYHYYKTCQRLQDATRRPREHDEDEPSGLEECADCQERREHNRRQRIGLSGPARNLVEADPEDYPLKTDGGTNTVESTQSRAAALVPDILDDLDRETSREFEQRASRMARNAELQYPVNASPRALAAASVYASGLLVNEKVYQDDLADTSDVSTTVIRRVYTEILNEEGIDFRNSDKESIPDESVDDVSPVDRSISISTVVMTLGAAIVLAGDFLLANQLVMTFGALTFVGGTLTSMLAFTVGLVRGEYL